jgi:hypothetical protein
MGPDDRPSGLYDGEESPEARSASLRAAGLVAVGLLVAAGLVAGGVWWARRGADAGTSAAADSTAPAAPAQNANSAERTTESGIVLRVTTGADDNFFGFGGPPEGAPAFCKVEGGVFVTAISSVGVAQTQMPLSVEAHPDGSGQSFVGGVFEGEPFWGAAVQVPQSVELVRVSNGRFGVDEAVPRDGLAVVAVGAKVNDDPQQFDPFAIDTSGLTVELVSADGVGRLDPDLLFGPPLFGDPECQMFPTNPVPDTRPPPPELPTAGDQPGDPALAADQVRAAMTALFTAPVERDREIFALVDDASGFDVYIRSGFGENEAFIDLLSDSELTFTDIVFISPVEAFFLYDVQHGGDNEFFFFDRLGRARFIDGAWKISRGTFCQEAVVSGVLCGV